jgi:nucleoside-diphosphate-sugar epimerase
MDHNVVQVGIVGWGYVGLPLAGAFCEAGHEVVGVDTDPRVVETLSRGESQVEDVPAQSLRAAGDGFRAGTRYHDDYIPGVPELGLRTEWADDADCTAVVTADPDLDVQRIVRESPLVVDFRGVTRGIEAPNLVRL